MSENGRRGSKLAGPDQIKLWMERDRLTLEAAAERSGITKVRLRALIERGAWPIPMEGIKLFRVAGIPLAAWADPSLDLPPSGGHDSGFF